MTIATLFLTTHTHAIADNTQDCLQLYYMKSYRQALPLCQQAAEKGYDQAQYVLGVMYIDGKGTKKNNKYAARWLKAAAIQGHAPARYKLQSIDSSHSDASRRRFTSSLWSKKINTQPPKSPQQSETKKTPQHSGIEVFTEPMSSQKKPAHNKRRDTTRSKILPHKKTTQSPIPMKANVAKSNNKKSDRNMFQHYVKAVRQGAAHDQLMLGLMYHEGRGIKKNDARAVYLFNQAANQGLANAQFSLALMLHGGHGVNKDEALAMQWLTRAANQGLAGAQYSLGLIYATSIASKDNKKAMHWWKQAAMQQHVQAQHNLAVMYLKGIGIKENRAEAIRWFQEESKQGNPIAQFNLGQLYSEGKWLDQNGQLAANWFYRAGSNHLTLGQKDAAMQAANKIKQLSSQLHLNVPNSFLADVLSKQIQEADEKL
ncbi:MAG: SEL1-like repeat protein [Mariprofundus sp.]|nr:SEL1-like repeat protein [Mariprofundus sp.]